MNRVALICVVTAQTYRTALMHACSGGHGATVKALLDAKAHVNEHDQVRPSAELLSRAKFIATVAHLRTERFHGADVGLE
jgi:ankyrin repeat protein